MLIINHQPFIEWVYQQFPFDFSLYRGSICYCADDGFGGFLFLQRDFYLEGIVKGKGRWITKENFKQFISYPFDILNANVIRGSIPISNIKAMNLAKRYFASIVRKTSQEIVIQCDRNSLNKALISLGLYA